VHDLGTQPAASISSTIQYQLPIVSNAAGELRSPRQKRLERSTLIFDSFSRTSPSGRATDASV
jgi:hypothetical protein